MRPAGEVRQALLGAAMELTTAERAPTLTELAAQSQVGFMVARQTICNMRRAGVLVIVRERRVEYRNRPVAEYAPALPGRESGWDAARVVLTSWAGEEAG